MFCKCVDEKNGIEAFSLRGKVFSVKRQNMNRLEMRPKKAKSPNKIF